MDQQLEEPGSRIELPREAMSGKERQQQLDSRADPAPARHMAAGYLTACVGNGHVQMCGIRRNRASQGQYFEVTAQFSRGVGTGESQLCNAETPDALDNEGCAQLSLTQRVFDGDTQIIAGRKAQRKGLHVWLQGSRFPYRVSRNNWFGKRSLWAWQWFDVGSIGANQVELGVV